MSCSSKPGTWSDIPQSKAKMSHYKREGTEDGKPAWDSKGVGMVMLRAPKEAGAKPFVTFTTEAVCFVTFYIL